MRLGRAFLSLLSLILLAMICSCGDNGPKVTGVTLTPSSSSVAAGQSTQLTVTFTYSNNASRPGSGATFASSNAAIATVDANGMVTSKSPGTVTITATFKGVSGTVTITVGASVLGSFSFSTTDLSLASGLNSTVSLSGTMSDGTGAGASAFANCTWSSSNLTFVTLSAATGASSKVQTHAPGSSTIKVTCGTLTPITTTVTVTAPVIVSVAVTPGNPSITVAATQQFTATATMTDNTQQNVTSSVTWTSSDTSKATITTGGLATGVAVGSTTIKATPTAGTPGTTVLTVKTASANLSGWLYAMAPSEPWNGGYTNPSLRIYTAQQDGTLAELSGSPVALSLTGYRPLRMVLLPSVDVLYVLYSNVSCDTGAGDGYVQMYTVNPKAGNVTLQGYSGMGVTTCPQQFGITPNGRYMYVAGNPGSAGAKTQVDYFAIDNNGYLMSSSAFPTLPTSFNTVARILFTPNSAYVYFSGDPGGHSTGSLLAASIDSGNGILTTVDDLSNPYLPGACGRGAIDAAGAHLYVSDAYSAQADPFRINSSSGALTSFSGWGYGNWSVYDLAFDPATPNLLYAAAAYGMYHGVIDFTQDSAGTVTSKNSSDLQNVNDWANRLLVNPGGGLIYVGTNTGKILVYSVNPSSGAPAVVQTVSPFTSADGGISFGFLPPGTGNIGY